MFALFNIHRFSEFASTLIDKVTLLCACLCLCTLAYAYVYCARYRDHPPRDIDSAVILITCQRDFSSWSERWYLLMWLSS